MRKVLLSAFVASLFGFGIANAQIQKGNVMVGGNLANLDVNLDGSGQFGVDVTPKAAWFIQDNVALGGYVNFGLQTAKNTATTTNYGVGALGRYYTGKDMEVVKHGRFFGEATVGVGGINVGDGGAKTNGFDFSFGPGFAYFVTPNIGLETLLKYRGTTGFGNDGYTSNLGLSFGFQIYLPGQSTARKVKNDMN